MAWYDSKDIAKLTVNGMDFTDWETVLVRHAFMENPLFSCRFTCSEGMPLAKNWAALRIRPGDYCTVTLGGILAFSGKVQIRQVFYDGRRHHIEIQCANNVDLYTSTFVTKTGEHKDKTLEQIVRAAVAKLGMNFKVEGGELPKIRIPRASISPGESYYDFLEMLVRHFGANGHPILLTSNPQGDLVAVVGPGGDSDTLVEGIDILEGREMIFNPEMSSNASVVQSQGTGSDQKHAAQVTHQPHHVGKMTASGRAAPPAVVISELPTSDKQMLKGRDDSERGWQTADQITAFITVRGWMRKNGDLWRVTKDGTVNIRVVSPMLILKGDENLHIHAVTFTQSNETGTRTVLELRNPNAERQTIPPVQSS